MHLKNMIKLTCALSTATLLVSTPISSFALNKQQKQIIECIDSINSPYPTDLIKGICWVESNLTQFNKDGTTFTDGSLNRETGKISHDFGAFQLNEDTLKAHGLTAKQINKVKKNTKFNILIGISVFEGKYAYVQKLKKQKNWKKLVKKYHLKGMSDTDLTILAYNGFSKGKKSSNGEWHHLYIDLVKQAIETHPWAPDMCLETHLNAK